MKWINVEDRMPEDEKLRPNIPIEKTSSNGWRTLYFSSYDEMMSYKEKNKLGVIFS
jgi:hypothetical protein